MASCLASREDLLKLAEQPVWEQNNSLFALGLQTLLTCLSRLYFFPKTFEHHILGHARIDLGGSRNSPFLQPFQCLSLLEDLL